MSTVYAGAKLKLRCPKCRGRTYVLREHYSAHVAYSVKDGVMPQEADDRFIECPTALSATCPCGHTWFPRGAKSLTDVVVEPQ